jgi:hypothetical protein
MTGKKIIDIIIDALVSADNEAKKFVGKYTKAMAIDPVDAGNRYSEFLLDELAMIEVCHVVITNLDKERVRNAYHNTKLYGYLIGYKAGMIENILGDLGKGTKLDPKELASLKVRASIIRDIFHIVK